MPKPIEVFIVFPVQFSVPFGRNHGLHARIQRIAKYGVAIISLVRNQSRSVYSFNKLVSLCTIRCGTFCNKHSDRHAMRIHGQMYF